MFPARPAPDTVITALLLWILAQGPAARAAELFRSGERLEAIAVLEEAVTQNPGDATLRAHLVECLMSVRRFERALEVMRPGAGDSERGPALFFLARYEPALEHLDRTDGHQALMVVDALEALGRLAERDRAIEGVCEVLGEEVAVTWILRGRRAASAGEHGRAADDYRAALELDPISAEALFGLGTALVRSGERDEGRRVLEEHRRVLPLLDELEFAERGLQLDPAHAPNQAAVGDVHRALGQVAEAEAYYRRAQELASDDELVPIVLRYARLEVEDKHDLAAAVRRLDEAVARVRDVRLLVRKGDLLAAHGRREDARAAYDRALDVRPGDPRILERIARLGDRR